MNINKILTVMVALAILMVFSNIIIGLIPWYKQIEPMVVHDKNRIFHPGDSIRIDIQRTALIGFEGRVTRELVKLHEDGAEEEVYKIDKLISINQGTKKISVYYQLPTIEICPQMSENTYMWRGSMVYKPFGLLEKTYFFRTEKFQLETNNESM